MIKHEDVVKGKVINKGLKGVISKVVDSSTVVVSVSRVVLHPVYKKVSRSIKKYKSDSCGLDLFVGDEVLISSSRPISKSKSWIVINKLSCGRR